MRMSSDNSVCSATDVHGAAVIAIVNLGDLSQGWLLSGVNFSRAAASTSFAVAAALGDRPPSCLATEQPCKRRAPAAAPVAFLATGQVSRTKRLVLGGSLRGPATSWGWVVRPTRLQ
jgi:hypothetical protein